MSAWFLKPRFIQRILSKRKAAAMVRAEQQGTALSPLVKTILCLKSVDRWSKTHTLVKENVAAHTAEVSLLTWLLVSYMNSQDTLESEIDLSTALTVALAHDLAESLTGDIITPTKKLIGYDLVKEAEQKAERALVDAAPNHISLALKLAFEGEGEQYELCKSVVKTCDRFVALAFAAREVNFGNVEMEHALSQSSDAFFSDPNCSSMLRALGVQGVTKYDPFDWCKASIDSAVNDLLHSERLALKR